LKYSNNISPEELERIERFLANEMLNDEAQAFVEELSTNEQLREKTEEVKLLLVGISELSLEERLEGFHKEILPAFDLKKKPGVVSLGRKLLVAASVLAVVFGVWWFLHNENSNKELYSKYYTPDPGLATVMSGSSDYTFNKAMVEYKNGEYDKALQAWKLLYEENSGNDTLAYFIGAAYQAKKDNENAIASLQQVATDTESVFYKDACWYLGLSYLKQGKTNQAVEYIQKSDHPQREAILKTINKK
jgi:tetratricopeptide (TPR) repeat protein